MSNCQEAKTAEWWKDKCIDKDSEIRLLNAVKLIIGRRANVSWHEVPDSEVDGYVAIAGELCREG